MSEHDPSHESRVERLDREKRERLKPGPFVAPVCWFDVPTVDGRMIRSGALTTPRQPIPLLAAESSYGARPLPIGTINAHHIHESVLWVFGQADPTKLPVDEHGNPIYTVGMDLMNVRTTMDGDLMIFENASLAAVTVTPEPAYPKARLSFEEWR